MKRTRILGVGLAALLLVPGFATQPQSSATAGQPAPRRSSDMNVAFLEVLEQSQKSGKGVLIYMGSHAIGGAVTKIGEHTVELRNREYARIVLRFDRIDGVAAN